MHHGRLLVLSEPFLDHVEVVLVGFLLTHDPRIPWQVLQLNIRVQVLEGKLRTLIEVLQ